MLDERAEGALYRIDFGALRPDPRVALREAATMTLTEGEAIRARLGRLDTATADGPWTRRALEAIRDCPGQRAADLCRAVGQERLPFKVNVRKLKALGLTESLEVGYRLSPRGAALLASWTTDDARHVERAAKPAKPTKPAKPALKRRPRRAISGGR